MTTAPFIQSTEQPFSSEKVVTCPECGGMSIYATSNPFRPFCGRTCQLGDLGRWATEEFRVKDVDSANGLDIES